jgi:RNA polymerase sigma-70 factor (ECF subfamily)
VPNPPPDFDTLFTEHAAFVWRLLRRLGVSEHDVEDVAQEVFLAVHQRLASFRGESRLATWVGAVCVHKAADHRRKAYRRRESPSDVLVVELAPDQERSLQHKRQLAELDRVLAQLPDAQREVLVLHEFGELSVAEIAEATGTPPKTVYTRLYAAREKVCAARAAGAARRLNHG